MTAIMLALGSYRFELRTATYQNYTRHTTWRWPQQDLIGRDPILQFMGPNLDTVELDGTIYPHFAGGLGQLGLMREEANKGTPLHMIEGARGRNLRRWVILSVKESYPEFFAAGIPRKIDFALSLKRYPDDEPARTIQRVSFFT